MSLSDYALQRKLGAEPWFNIRMSGIAITAIAEATAMPSSASFHPASRTIQEWARLFLTTSV